MAKKAKAVTYQDAVQWFRARQFDILDAPGTSNRVFLKKYNCSAAIEKAPNGGAKIFAYPDNTIVVPGHGPATTVEIERATNAYLI